MTRASNYESALEKYVGSSSLAAVHSDNRGFPEFSPFLPRKYWTGTQLRHWPLKNLKTGYQQKSRIHFTTGVFGFLRHYDSGFESHAGYFLDFKLIILNRSGPRSLN